MPVGQLARTLHVYGWLHLQISYPPCFKYSEEGDHITDVHILTLTRHH